MTVKRVDHITEAIEAGAEALFTVQRPDGVFDYGRQWTSTLATVGATTALHFADRDRSTDLITAGALWLVSTQGTDGGWSTVPGVPPEAGPTAVATAALQIVRPAAAADAIRAGRAWLERHGGIEAIAHQEMAAVCRQFYALAGWLDPASQRRLPLELALFPGLFRRLLDFRAPIVAAAALAQARNRPQAPMMSALQRLGRPSALNLLHQIYEHEGGTGEFSDDPWAAGLICSALARAEEAPDLVDATVAWLRGKANPDGSWNMMPLDLTWSVYAASSLIDAGYGADPRLAATTALFHDRQQDHPFTAFGCPPGFWGWSGARGWPASVETAEITAVLARSPGGRDDTHAARGIGWLTAQQDRRGSWSLCVRHTRVDNCGPCPHTTAQAVHALLSFGLPPGDRRVWSAVRWLLTAQEPDGSFDSVWYRPRTAGTSVVLEVLAAVGMADHPAAERARGWLINTQGPDGSWGPGDGTAEPSVEETAWAVRALLDAGVGAERDSVRRGVAWLLNARQPDGNWPQAPVSEFIRGASRFPNGGLTNGLALRALARFRTEMPGPGTAQEESGG